ncbi:MULTISPECIES: bifunctional oligoribonuclease/PAP phosphatase NrnA [unclassified Lentimicrobium]|uniref:DHH family phosphoesterase n=1 Tax=unclassified Lentimicrobium TaxID=2677434 RepID=UPI00155491CB|nr:MULTISPECIES: bifunctional oligoribonuclease/PAP phosphatase NrnA [unclassified Lentimicrobium]NPD45429.1 bifunctional oligoribonuclease/PAP phosphatase NrnA [Lentimicrobium sp. S6]NPD83791.1 bifunctional oligoribonuclease/PAP phosphatase NrnA [Lentimicrobium sp. L6]
MNTKDYKGLELYVKKAKKLVLSTHSNPDGDTLGSCLGLYHFFKTIGIESQIISPDPSPTFLNWMPSYKEVCIYQEDKAKADRIINNADVILHVDYNAIHRTGDEMSLALKNANQAHHIMIDHHPSPESGFKAYVSDVSACSTAQLAFYLTQEMSNGSLLNQEAATCLYVGLITDTGSFSYGMVDESPYLIAAQLVKAGIDDKSIHEKVYSNNTLNRLKLLGYALSEKLVVIKEEEWAYISLHKEELEKYHFQSGDTEGIVNYALSIEGVKAAILLTHRNDKIRLSFRSKGDFAINGIARNHFDGGGHLNAAGGNSKLTMDETIEKLKTKMSALIMNPKNK